MSKQASHDILKALINNARNNDQILANIIQVANGVVTMDNAANTAVALGNVLLQQNQSDDAVAQGMVNGFKAVLYVDWTTATNRRLNDNNIHNNLVNIRNQIVNGLGSQGTVNPAVPGNGTSIFTTSATTNNNIFSAPAQSNDSIFGSAPASGGASTAELFGSAPTSTTTENIFATAPAPAQAPATPAAAPVAAKPKPEQVFHVEKYQDHELSIDYSTAAVPPRRANETIKQYSQTNDWGDALEAALKDGKGAITFGDSDIIGKIMDHHHTFIGYDDATKDILQTFLNLHHTALNELKDLEQEDDTTLIMKKVNSSVDMLRQATQSYINSMTEACKDKHTLLMDALNMAAVYQERVRKYLMVGFRIGSNGFIAPGGRAFSIDNVVLDMKSFSSEVYNKFCDGNGVCSEDDYFRDLFLTIARALTKLQIGIQDSGEVDIISTKYVLMTSGEYNNIGKESAVSAVTFGPALSSVISDVYHRLHEVLPHGWLIVRTPHKDVVMLGTDDGSIIRY